VPNTVQSWLIPKIKPIVPKKLMKPISAAMYRLRCWRYRADLNRLALLYGTDKNGSHFYTQHYQRYFSAWRLRRLRILEIGVGGYEDASEGAWSLRMWKKFFPNAHIVGIDLFDKSHFSEERITVLQCDQTDATRLAAISAEYGPFDIIIDDGSHLNEHVIRSFHILFPLLQNPGFYAIEDLQTAYWPSWGGVKGRSSMDYLTSLTDGINYAEHPDRLPEEFDKTIVEAAFFHNLCILRKGDNTEPSNAPHFVAAEA
jgi:hypothetical protein